MKKLFLFALACLPILALNGCSSAADGGDDESEVAESEDGLSTSARNFGYVALRRDFRKCMFPMCGGYFARRVNLAKTQCVDGSYQDECYVASVELKGMGLSQREEEELANAAANGSALLKVRAYKKRINGATFGTLKASEGWVAATGSPIDGTFYRAYDNGIRCITAPCPSTSAVVLNGRDEWNLKSLNFDSMATKPSDEILDRAQRALGSTDGLLFAGGVALPKCLPSAKACGPFGTVSEFFLRVVAREGKSCGGRAQGDCNVGQFCSWAAGDLCGAADAPGKCSYRPDACIALYKPVCGCDGKTYSNSCQAASAGVGVLNDSACTNP